MSFGRAWSAAPLAVRRSLELAFDSLAGGGLACGSVLTDAAGKVLAEGRNRAYDGPGGSDPLQGTPLAHAEMNVLARARSDWQLGELTLWSSLEPCSMCAAAAEFTGVGAVRALAPDPWALATGQSTLGDAYAAGEEWLIASHLMFLRSIVHLRGPEHPTVQRNRAIAPETATVLDAAPAAPGSSEELLAPVWERITDAADLRRRGRA